MCEKPLNQRREWIFLVISLKNQSTDARSLQTVSRSDLLNVCLCVPHSLGYFPNQHNINKTEIWFHLFNRAACSYKLKEENEQKSFRAA